MFIKNVPILVSLLVCSSWIIAQSFSDGKNQPITLAEYDHEATVARLRGAYYFTQWFEGARGKKLKIYEDYEAFRDFASEAQIIELMESNNPMARLYALDAYAVRFPDRFFEKALPFLKDHAEASTYAAGSVSLYGINLQIYPWFSQDRSQSTTRRRMRSLPPEKQKLMTQVIIEDAMEKLEEGPLSKAHIFFMGCLLDKYDVSENYLDDLAMLADHGVDAALIPLATWHPEAYVHIFEDRLKKGDPEIVLEAILSWPHPNFLPHFIELLKADVDLKMGFFELEHFYAKLIAYPKDQSDVLIPWLARNRQKKTSAWDDRPGILFRVIWNDAFERYSKHLFLLIQERKSFQYMDWQRLYEAHPEETIHQIYSLLSKDLSEAKDSYVPDLVKALQQLEPGQFLHHLNRLLPTIGEFAFTDILKAAIPFESEVTFEVLHARLKAENNPKLTDLIKAGMRHIDPDRANQVLD